MIKKNSLSCVDRRKIWNRICVLWVMVCLFCSNYVISYAGTNYGENIGKWFLDQLFWIALAIVGYLVIRFLLKGAYAAMVIIFIIGGLVCFYLKSPESISTLGNSLAKTIGL